MTTLLTVDHDVFIMIIDKVYKRRKELNDILFNTIVANYRFVHRFNWKRYVIEGSLKSGLITSINIVSYTHTPDITKSRRSSRTTYHETH